VDAQPGSNSGLQGGQEEEEPRKPPKVVYGYIRVVAGDEVRVTTLKAGLLVFCRSNGFMLSTVFTDFGADDISVVRPGSYGVMVPSRLQLSSDAATLETLTLQIKRTAAKLIAVDDVTAVGPSRSGSDAHP
jgi:hypothetical protein